MYEEGMNMKVWPLKIVGNSHILERLPVFSEGVNERLLE